MKPQALCLLPLAASALPARPGDSCGAALRTVHQFANGTWLENIAVGADGRLLLTGIDAPNLYQLDALNGTGGAATVHRFDGYTSTLGISEAEPGVFAVATGNVTQEAGPVAGSFALWAVDVRGPEVRVSKVADMPDAVFLNGLTSFDMDAGVVLVSDSTRGVVYRVDTRSGSYGVAIEDAAFEPPADADFPLGINGIRYSDGRLYYTSTFGASFGSVPVDAVSGEATGPVEVVAPVAGDDFALGEGGTAFMTVGRSSAVVGIAADGTTTAIAGSENSTAVPGPTSAAFGRTPLDRDVLYVTTSGRGANGYREGGKVVAIRV